MRRRFVKNIGVEQAGEEVCDEKVREQDICEKQVCEKKVCEEEVGEEKVGGEVVLRGVRRMVWKVVRRLVVPGDLLPLVTFLQQAGVQLDEQRQHRAWGEDRMVFFLL